MGSLIFSILLLIGYLFACLYFVINLVEASANGDLCQTIKYSVFTLITFGNLFRDTH